MLQVTSTKCYTECGGRFEIKSPFQSQTAERGLEALETQMVVTLTSGHVCAFRVTC